MLIAPCWEKLTGQGSCEVLIPLVLLVGKQSKYLFTEFNLVLNLFSYDVIRGPVSKAEQLTGSSMREEAK